MYQSKEHTSLFISYISSHISNKGKIKQNKINQTKILVSCMSISFSFSTTFFPPTESLPNYSPNITIFIQHLLVIITHLKKNSVIPHIHWYSVSSLYSSPRASKSCVCLFHCLMFLQDTIIWLPIPLPLEQTALLRSIWTHFSSKLMVDFLSSYLTSQQNLRLLEIPYSMQLCIWLSEHHLHFTLLLCPQCPH